MTPGYPNPNSRFPEDYNKSWQTDLIAAYKDGKSDIWCMAHCFGDHKVSSPMFYRWVKKDEEFCEVRSYGLVLSQAWWEDLAQAHAQGNAPPGANPTSIIFNMCNRFKDAWRQKQVIEEIKTLEVSFSTEELPKLTDFLVENGVDINVL